MNNNNNNNNNGRTAHTQVSYVPQKVVEAIRTDLMRDVATKPVPKIKGAPVQNNTPLAVRIERATSGRQNQGGFGAIFQCLQERPEKISEAFETLVKRFKSKLLTEQMLLCVELVDVLMPVDGFRVSVLEPIGKKRSTPILKALQKILKDNKFPAVALEVRKYLQSWAGKYLDSDGRKINHEKFWKIMAEFDLTPTKSEQRNENTLVPVPSYWTGVGEVSEVAINENTEEWRKIASLFYGSVREHVRPVENNPALRMLCKPNPEIRGITRIENRSIWKLYSVQKENVRSTCQTSANELIDAQDMMITPSCNECYLFHGTSEFQAIKGDGFGGEYYSPIDGAGRGNFGAGNYFAQNSSKSFHYCTPAKDGHYYMFLARVVLGNAYIAKEMDQTMVKWRKPPTEYGKTFDSVVAPAIYWPGYDKTKFLYSEYVIYDGNQAYPEYLIKFVIPSYTRADKFSFGPYTINSYGNIVKIPEK